MKWIRDTTGRFQERPYYEADELDYECEAAVSSFLLEKHGAVSFPISTNDLTIILESVSSDLDLYADLSSEGNNVEGVTDFIANSKPRVRITQTLSDVRLENRLRTTLTHEFAHVKLHSFLWPHGQLPLFGASVVLAHSPRCKRETIVGAPQNDWMEWQAGYASGALLMPVTPLRQTVNALFEANQVVGRVEGSSPLGRDLMQRVQVAFEVSADAARVRLTQRGYLSDHPNPSRLNGF